MSGYFKISVEYSLKKESDNSQTPIPLMGSERDLWQDWFPCHALTRIKKHQMHFRSYSLSLCHQGVDLH